MFLNKKSLRKFGSIKNKLSYTIQQLKEHLENKFKEVGNEWMSWQNYGNYRLDLWDDNNTSTWRWQIDHIIPHSTFNYKSMNDEEFKKCWALENLRPLSAKENVLSGYRR
jgi:hypothetical protein